LGSLEVVQPVNPDWAVRIARETHNSAQFDCNNKMYLFEFKSIFMHLIARGTSFSCN